MSKPIIGVLALQGDVGEHLRMLASAGAHARPVRHPDQLDGLDGLVVPGGESTTIARLADTFDLLEPLRQQVKAGLPTYGSCAGMILLADRLEDGVEGQQTIGGLDVVVRRNAFGRQVDSFEADLDLAGVPGSPYRAVFIRAPWVVDAGPAVDIVGAVADGPAAGRIVAVRQGGLLATAFHPELTGDPRVHAGFVEMVQEKLGESRGGGRQ
jgi:5'-phosphate synthase pdxT subunit